MLNLFPDCFPCALAGALRTAAAAGATEAQQWQVLANTATLLATWPRQSSAVELGRAVQRLVRHQTSCDDPYRIVKAQANEVMLHFLPKLRSQIHHASDPLGEALRLAACANRIDFGSTGFTVNDLSMQLEELLFGPTRPSFRRYDRALLDEYLKKAEHVVFLVDNAGEIVADRALIESIPVRHKTAVVRGAPTINDSTIVDARAVSLHEVCTVIDTGSDLPGIPAELPVELADLLSSASIIIAKGQGNFETLFDRKWPCFYLLMAKCGPVASTLAVPAGSLVLAASDGVI